MEDGRQTCEEQIPGINKTEALVAFLCLLLCLIKMKHSQQPSEKETQCVCSKQNVAFTPI